MATVTTRSDFGAPKTKFCHCFHCFPIYLPWSDGTRCHNLSFLNAELFFFCLFGFFFECWVLNQLFYSPLSLPSRGTLVMIAIDWMFASKVHVNHNGPILWYLKVCLYHEGGALVNRTSALIKRGLESFLTSFTWSYKEKTGIYVPGSKLSPDIKPASTIMLDSSASRIVTNQFPWFINHQSIVFSLEPD